MRNGNKVSAG